MNPSSATVSAAANIALIKYWGKANTDGNQPATGSLSLGLDDLRTTTTLSRTTGEQDSFETELDEAARQRILAYLDRARQQHGIEHKLHIQTRNNFPTGTGLASSASGFAALALAFNALFNLKLTDTALSRLARLGSGSAARSVFGGIVEVIAGSDAYAAQLRPAEDWPLDILVAVTDEAPKALGSTEAMQRTASSSSFYPQWLATHRDDMDLAKKAIADKDFAGLADISELNCLKMHATMLTSQPPIIYWLPATLTIILEVRSLRAKGIPVFFSIDAGAQVKLICLPEASAQVRHALEDLPGISRIIQTRLGGTPTVQVS